MIADAKLTQPANAPVPINVTLLGMEIEVKLVQDPYLQLIVFQFVLLKTVEKWLYRFY